MRDRIGRAAWMAGWPARFVLLALIRGYRVSLGKAIGGNCRFYPSCSAYAEMAVAGQGAVRGTALTVWRVLRCSPLSRGGVDVPPAARLGGHAAGKTYDDAILPEPGGPPGLGADRPSGVA